ncbi:acyltransferase family protein [Nocardia pseudobrasiliensis]|uniref:Surface polysaccharide O-acyltransferase-like enzyme n=1 Tax=Nocardia pseudobrasiliensis TaxID=45979 RepID=A0A370I8G9_9NOCA|nr:acyltransferase [Nocardia pseudobrasiliensis]RDI67037.1 surface polysaccharide O-acyltransferase-like enzyme [Nocardia pseudobrasiliensis]
MTVAAGGWTHRNWTIDLARAFAITVVVVVHWISVRITVTDHAVRGDPSLHGKPIWALSWVLQVMPLFFVAGGLANTRIVDRWRQRGTGYAAYLGPRVRRLVAPMIPLLTVLTSVVVLLRLHSATTAKTAAYVLVSPLWFLAVYLVAVIVAPWAVWAHDRAVWVLPVLLLGVAATLDGLKYSGIADVAQWNLLFVWLFCHQLGVLYSRETLARIPDAGLVAIAVLGVAVLLAMVFAGPYPPTMYGLGDAPVSNLYPPTTAMAVLAMIQVALLVGVDRRVAGREPSRRVRGIAGFVIAHLMTIYLWHIPIIAFVTGAAVLAPDLLLPSDPGTWWLMRPLWLLGCGVVLVGAVRALGRWDAFCAGYAARATPAATVAGALVATASIYVIWWQRLSPTIESGLAIVGIFAAGALLSTTRRPGRSDAEATPLRPTPSRRSRRRGAERSEQRAAGSG